MQQARKILVVDDEESLVQLCRIILEAAGYQVRGAYNGRQALHLIAEDLPDLVLLDVMMPGMSGIEVCRQIRAQHRDFPRIIMYTADDRHRTRLESLKAGANDVLTKETPLYDIANKVSSYLAPH